MLRRHHHHHHHHDHHQCLKTPSPPLPSFAVYSKGLAVKVGTCQHYFPAQHKTPISRAKLHLSTSIPAPPPPPTAQLLQYSIAGRSRASEESRSAGAPRANERVRAFCCRISVFGHALFAQVRGAVPQAQQVLASGLWTVSTGLVVRICICDLLGF